MKTKISILFVCLLQACTSVQTSNESDSAIYADSNLDAARAMIGPQWPQNSNTRLTTAGDIYLNNLDGQISSLEQLLSSRSDAQLIAYLALDYYHRFQILGRLSDAERARALLKTASEGKHEPAIDLAYAQVLIGFHEFDQAAAALTNAERNGAKTQRVAELSAAIVRAIGGASESDGLDLLVDAGSDEPAALNSVGLVTRASEKLKYGEALTASELLRQAQDKYVDSAPYLLAWIHVQQGIVFLRYHDYSSAAVFFSAAHDRFPQYALATEHLAETQLAMGNYRDAVRLYQQVAEQTGNPEFYYQLSVAENALGLKTQAKEHSDKARSDYVDLLSRYPTMYADHAARYYLDIGDVNTAVDLAWQNIQQRHDLRARTLLLEVELAAGNQLEACNQFLAIQNYGYQPPELPALSSQLTPGCSDRDL